MADAAPDESQILERLNAGDPREATRLAFGFYGNRIKGMLTKFFKGNQAAAEVVLQETFVKVLTNFAGFRRDGAVYTWIYSIARHTAICWAKQSDAEKKAQVALSQASPSKFRLQRSTTPSHALDRRKAIEAATASLTEWEAQLIDLKLADELPWKEILVAVSAPDELGGLTEAQRAKAEATLRQEYSRLLKRLGKELSSLGMGVLRRQGTADGDAAR